MQGAWLRGVWFPFSYRSAGRGSRKCGRLKRQAGTLDAHFVEDTLDYGPNRLLGNNLLREPHQRDALPLPRSRPLSGRPPAAIKPNPRQEKIDRKQEAVYKAPAQFGLSIFFLFPAKYVVDHSDKVVPVVVAERPH